MKSILFKTLTAVLTVCALILIIFSLSACDPYYGTYSDGTFSYTTNGKSFTVIGCKSEAEEVEIPSTFYYKEKNLPVTAIASHAFSRCANLSKIKIPASVKSIEQSSFTGCNITDIEISPDNAVYHSAGNCIIETNSKKLICGFPSSVIPADGSVEIIGGMAFYGCAGIEEVTIPASITKIGGGAFAACPDIKSYTVEEGNENYFSLDGILYNFDKTEILAIPPKIEGEITVPDGIEKLEDNAFDGLSGITEIILPLTLKSIGAKAFSGISAREIIIPDSVTEITEGALDGCTKLESISVPYIGANWQSVPEFKRDNFGSLFGENSSAPKSLASVTVRGGTVKRSAFSNCKNIKEITLGAGVTQIDAFAFDDCGGLNKLVIENADCATDRLTFLGLETVTNATLPAGVLENFGEKNLKGLRYAVIFGEGEIADRAFENSSLERIILAEGITKIGYSAFKGSKLKSISFAESVTQIGNSAFQNCTLLESVSIPSKVKVIDIFTFKGCTSLETLTFPEGLTEISANSVQNCTALKSITIPESVEYIGASAFNNCTSLEEVNFNATDCATNINNYWVFNGCGNLSIVKIGENVSKIPSRLFGFCSGLCKISGGESVNFIGKNAFYGCTSLESISFSNEMTSIDEQAFYGCSALKSIKINPKKIDSSAFNSCSALKTVIFGSAIEGMEANAFHACDIEKIFYEGTSQEWYKVLKSYEFGNATKNAVFYFYSEENPQNSGNFWHYVNGLPEIW